MSTLGSETTFRRLGKTKKTPIAQVETSLLNLEEQIGILSKLPEDSVAAVPINLSKTSDRNGKGKKVGNPELLHSTSRSSLNEDDALNGRLQEMISHYKAIKKDAASAESGAPSPNSTSSKSNKEKKPASSLNTPKSISRSGSVRSLLGSKGNPKKPVRSYKLGRSHSSKDDSTATDRSLTEKDPSPRTEESGSNVHEKPTRHPGMIKRLSMKAVPNRRGSHSESPKPANSVSPNNSGNLTTKYKTSTVNTAESSQSKSSEKTSREAFTRSKSSKEKTEKKEKDRKEKKEAAKDTENDELPEMEFTKAHKGRRGSSSPGSHRSSDSMTILPTNSVLSTAGATMVGVNDILSTATPESIPPLKSFRQLSDPGIFSDIPVRWKNTFYIPPEKTRSGLKGNAKQSSGTKRRNAQSMNDFLSPESRSSTSGGTVPAIHSKGSPRQLLSRSSTEQGPRSTDAPSSARSKQSSPQQSLSSLASSSTPSSQPQNTSKKYHLRNKANKKEPFLPLDIAKIIEARANGDNGLSNSSRTIDSLRILPQSGQDEDEGELLFSPDLSSDDGENRLRKARLSNDPPEPKSMDNLKLKESKPVPEKKRSKSMNRRSLTAVPKDKNKDFVESLSDPTIVRVSGSSPNIDTVKNCVADLVTDSEVKREIQKIEDKIADTDPGSEPKKGSSKRRNKTSSRRDTFSEFSEDKEVDFRSPRKKRSAKKLIQSSRNTTPSNTPTLLSSTERGRKHTTIPMFDTEWERITATGIPVASHRSKKKIGSVSGESTVVEPKTSPQVSPRTDVQSVGSTTKKTKSKKLRNENAKRAQSIESAFSPRKVPLDGQTMVPVKEGQSGFRNIGRTIYQSDNEIVGMSLPVLIDVVFELNGSMNRELCDPLLSRAFWRTYFLFLPALDLLRELITRLEAIMARSKANPGAPFDRRVFIRVYEIVRCWIKFYFFDNEDFDFSMRLEKLDKMLLKVGARDKAKPSLTDCLQKTLKESVKLPSNLSLTFNRDVDAAFSMIELEPRDFALQLSIYVHQWIIGLQPIEFFSSMKEFAGRETPFYTHLCNYHTAFSDFVLVTVLYGVKKEVRLNSLKYFVEVAIECRARNDYFNLSAILCGLSSGPVQRLHSLWAMDTKLSEKLRKCSDGFFPSGALYRTALKNLVADGEFFIPDITQISRDIMHTMENPAYLSSSHHDSYKSGKKNGDLPLVNLDRLRFFDKLFHVLRASQKFRMAYWVEIDETTNKFLILLNRYKPVQAFHDTFYYDRANDLEQRSLKKKVTKQKRRSLLINNSQETSSMSKTSGTSGGVMKYFYSK